MKKTQAQLDVMEKIRKKANETLHNLDVMMTEMIVILKDYQDIDDSSEERILVQIAQDVDQILKHVEDIKVKTYVFERIDDLTTN